jgi:hypothetical protein
MDDLHIVHVEIGPSPIQAESKFSQIGPSSDKDNPRKRLGFPVLWRRRHKKPATGNPHESEV